MKATTSYERISISTFSLISPSDFVSVASFFFSFYILKLNCILLIRGKKIHKGKTKRQSGRESKQKKSLWRGKKLPIMYSNATAFPRLEDSAEKRMKVQLKGIRSVEQKNVTRARRAHPRHLFLLIPVLPRNWSAKFYLSTWSRDYHRRWRDRAADIYFCVITFKMEIAIPRILDAGASAINSLPAVVVAKCRSGCVAFKR